MIPSQSFYVSSQSAESLERTELRNAIYNQSSINFLTKAGIKQGMRVLDLGCGKGIMSCNIAKLVGQTGQVIGLDNSLEQILCACQNVQDQQIKNVFFITGSIDDLHHYILSHYDAIYIRFLLMHLQDPEHVIKKAKQLLKPGGILAIEEPLGFETIKCFPEYKTVTNAILWCKRLFDLNNTDSAIGHKLKYMLAKHFQAPATVSSFHPVLRTEKEKHMLQLLIKSFADEFVQYKIKTHKEILQLTQEITRLEKNPTVYITYFQVAQAYVKNEL